mgnify:CR=1 FL=1
MARIHQLSAGNPFYAIELARALTESARRGGARHVGGVGTGQESAASIPPSSDVLLAAAACLAAPTVELVGKATWLTMTD